MQTVGVASATQQHPRLAILAPHPVQYHVPVYRALSTMEGISTTVLYLEASGLKPVYIREFADTIHWDIDLVSGYRHQFIGNLGGKVFRGFFSRVNPGLLRALKRSQFDVILLSGYATLSEVGALLWSKLLGLKVILRGEATIRKDSCASARQRIKAVLLPRLLSLCDVVLYSCSANREYFELFGVPSDKLVAYPCSVDNRYFREQARLWTPRKRESRRELGIEVDEFVVLFCGQLTPRKRALDLLHAVAELRDRRLVCLFVGGGPQREMLEEVARSKEVRAVFVGFQNQGQISKYYGIADVGVVTSDYDPSPKVLNEIMNFAVPVIVSEAVGTAPDLVRNGINGFRVAMGDVPGITRALHALAADTQRAKEMGEQSRRIVSEWAPEVAASGIVQAVAIAVAGAR